LSGGRLDGLPSLRGAQRRSNPAFHPARKLDCFAYARNDGLRPIVLGLHPGRERRGCEIIPKRRTIGKIAFVIGPTSKLPTIVLGGESGDIDAMTHDAGASMLTDKFDPYGGMLPGDPDDKAGLSGMSSVLSRFGQIAFWALVVIVVVARMKYFSAGPYF
jgi:hypothetical protein